MHDFQAKLGQNTKVYPFLTQRSSLSQADAKTFLEPGRATNGVVYFEQTDSWGGCYPAATKAGVKLKISICDVFGRTHSSKVFIQRVTLEEARKYNPSFGKTFAEMRGEILPHDKDSQQMPSPNLNY